MFYFAHLKHGSLKSAVMPFSLSNKHGCTFRDRQNIQSNEQHSALKRKTLTCYLFYKGEVYWHQYTANKPLLSILCPTFQSALLKGHFPLLFSHQPTTVVENYLSKQYIYVVSSNTCPEQTLNAFNWAPFWKYPIATIFSRLPTISGSCNLTKNNFSQQPAWISAQQEFGWPAFWPELYKLSLLPLPDARLWLHYDARRLQDSLDPSHPRSQSVSLCA